MRQYIAWLGKCLFFHYYGPLKTKHLDKKLLPTQKKGYQRQSAIGKEREKMISSAGEKGEIRRTLERVTFGRQKKKRIGR